MNHAECRHAVWRDGKAFCPHCGEPVAESGHSVYTVSLRGDVGRRPKDHDRLAAYGLGDRARLRGKSPRRQLSVPTIRGGIADGQKRRGIVDLGEGAAYLYCPNRACQRGMHVEAPSA